MVERVGGGEQMEMEDVDLCGDLFDHIDDLLDFPADHDLVLDGVGGGRGSNLLWTEPLLPAPSESGFSGPDSCLSATDEDLAAAGLSVPTEDIPELEWLSSFVEDSFSAGSFGLEEDRSSQKDSGFRTASPVSVLDSTSSSAPAKPVASLLSPHIVVPARARSKRPRPAKFSPRLPLTLVSPTSSSDETDPIAALPPPLVNCADFSAEFNNFAESQPRKKMAKSKKRPPQPPSAAFDSLAQPVRKCMHCQIQKTPQWRAGPLGPKTLCNACGVRYKSGRLYPEYRPAASPTFVPSVHSNSHKKVLEMRTKMGQKEPAPVPYFVRKASPISSTNSGTNNRLAIDHDMED